MKKYFLYQKEALVVILSIIHWTEEIVHPCVIFIIFRAKKIISNANKNINKNYYIKYYRIICIYNMEKIEI